MAIRDELTRAQALRAALRQVLRDHDAPMRVEEMHRGLLVRGMCAPEPRAKAIWDALRAEARRGSVERTAPGEFTWVGVAG